MKLVVTGGLGFIGSALVRAVCSKRPAWQVVNIDKQTYAGRPENVAGLNHGSSYRWVKADICDAKAVDRAMAGAGAVIHLAAETHVDRSIHSSDEFLRTNVLGTRVLLDAARRHEVKKFIHVGTDEVYGSVEKGAADEDAPLLPNSPYSSSKAAGDLLARSYFVTHKVPVIVTRASNNFGPRQFPEKALPLLITNALDGKPYPLYGDGLQVRDWLYVEDHVDALLFLLEKGKAGEIYNVGGTRSATNKELVTRVLKLMGKPLSLVTPVPDRPGHDRRYALDCGKLAKLGWKPKRRFEEALLETVEWYATRRDWWEPIKNASSFKSYYKKQYRGRV
jgi:dTDP-glucose 4,6-dehydratase